MAELESTVDMSDEQLRESAAEERSNLLASNVGDVGQLVKVVSVRTSVEQ
jgi:hypothetical protein